MTTIAYKDGVIAYDSRVTRGDLITDDDCDKCIERDGVKFFMSGALCDYDALVGAYFGTAPSGKVDASAIVVDAGKLMMVAVDDDTGLWKSPIKPDRPYASAAAHHTHSLRWIWAHLPRRPSRWRQGAIQALVARSARFVSTEINKDST